MTLRLFGVYKLKGRLPGLVRIYSFQNATLLEIMRRGLIIALVFFPGGLDPSGSKHEAVCM